MKIKKKSTFFGIVVSAMRIQTPNLKGHVLSGPLLIADENPNLKGLVLNFSRWLQSSTSSSYDCYYGIGISTPSVKRMLVDNEVEFGIATSESLSLSSRSVIKRTHAHDDDL